VHGDAWRGKGRRDHDDELHAWSDEEACEDARGVLELVAEVRFGLGASQQEHIMEFDGVCECRECIMAVWVAKRPLQQAYGENGVHVHRMIPSTAAWVCLGLSGSATHNFK
jgi:hypothetical protein